MLDRAARFLGMVCEKFSGEIECAPQTDHQAGVDCRGWLTERKNNALQLHCVCANMQTYVRMCMVCIQFSLNFTDDIGKGSQVLIISQLAQEEIKAY